MTNKNVAEFKAKLLEKVSKDGIAISNIDLCRLRCGGPERCVC